MTEKAKAVGQLSEDNLAIVFALLGHNLKDLSKKLYGRYKLRSDIFF